MTERRCDVVVFFGATGDLAAKQIFPALFAMFRRGQLDIPVVGVARSDLSRADFHQRAKASLQEAGQAFSDREFKGFASNLHYLSGDYADPATFDKLGQQLGGYAYPLFYMAIPPGMFEAVADGIKRLGCGPVARLVVEKPFGRNLESALKLNETLHRCFPEESVFRIDHFLALETVGNLVYFRLANAFLHPLWSHRYIKNVQITLAESFGVEGRGAFYDDIGAVRDVVQNHLFQILGLLAMEPPEALDSVESLHRAQLQTFRDIKPVQLSNVVFGQFAGYRNEHGVKPASNTETYVAMRLEIDNERWQGVPFYIRTGKALAATCTEVMLTLKPADYSGLDAGRSPLPNYFRFRLEPGMEIAIGAQIKSPGRRFVGDATELIVQREQHGAMAPYERLLADAIDGDQTLFTRSDNMEAAWKIVDAILDHDQPVARYQPGSWGPDSSCHVLINGDQWHTPAA